MVETEGMMGIAREQIGEAQHQGPADVKIRHSEVKQRAKNASPCVAGTSLIGAAYIKCSQW